MKIMNSSKESRIYKGIALVIVALMTFPMISWADEGDDNGNGGFFSGIGKGLSNLTSGVPGIFQELSPADVGVKPRIRPHFAFTQGFISNARLGDKQGDAAWQARIAPGITVAVPSGKLYTEVDYTYGFATTQGRKTTANISTHNLNALARYDLSADTILGVGNNIQLSEVPGEPGDPFILETATAQIKHRLSPKLTAALTDTFQWFEDKSKTRPNDFVDNGVDLNFAYDVTQDFTAGPGFAWHVRNFDDRKTKNYWQMEPRIGTSYRLGPKTTVGGNFGWAYRRFDTKIAGNDSESELVYGAKIDHKLGRKFVWAVSYQKALVDTFATDFVFRDTPAAVALDNLDRDFRIIKSHRLGSSVSYNIDERNSLGVFGDFQFLEADGKNNVFSDYEANEKAMEVGFKYTYRISRYIGLDAGYSFGRRFTSDGLAVNSRNEYTFHKATAGVNISV